MREYCNSNARGVDKMNQLCSSYRYNHSEKKWWKTVFEEIIQITLSNIYIIYSSHFGGNVLRRKDFHVEVVKYLMAAETVERSLKFEHYSDWVSLKKEYLNNKTEGKRDFRLNCKNKNCKKKTDLYCPGCSTKDYICAFCVPECFIEYHKESLR